MNPELVSKINAALDANGGKVLWSDFVETLTDREKPFLHDHLRAMKKQGVAQRQLIKVDGQHTTHIVRMSAQETPESEVTS